MRKTVTIDPVARIEGHARVCIRLTADGRLESAGLVVNEFRGLERILTGMEAARMPHVTARICGVCPIAHHLAASHALDRACGVTPPPAAVLLRELMYMGHIIDSHALSIFVLQGPDLVMGLDAEPARRSVTGMVQENPNLGRAALALRSMGRKISEMVGGRGPHPVTSVAGGIAFDLDSGKRGIVAGWVEEARRILGRIAPEVKALLVKTLELNPAMKSGWAVPSWGLGTVKDGRISLTSGKLVAVDEMGAVRNEFDAGEYDRYLVESAAEWSHVKQVTFNSDGLHDYRVGPMARINVGKSYGTQTADAELAEFARVGGAPCHATVLQTWAKLIELIWAVERAAEILRNPAIMGETRVPVRFREGRGVGHVEAPRGTLFHDYRIDGNGIIREAHLVVATQQNYTVINRSIEQAALSHVVGREDDAALLNAVEFSIRCYDPCLSCATHPVGRMPLQVVITRGGVTVRTVGR